MSTLLRRCHDCGQPLGKKELFCPRCGAKQPRGPKKQIDRISGIIELYVSA
jgi:rRNA maturation endonuclease Nob1